MHHTPVSCCNVTNCGQLFCQNCSPKICNISKKIWCCAVNLCWMDLSVSFFARNETKIKWTTQPFCGANSLSISWHRRSVAICVFCGGGLQRQRAFSWYQVSHELLHQVSSFTNWHRCTYTSHIKMLFAAAQMVFVWIYSVLHKPNPETTGLLARPEARGSSVCGVVQAVSVRKVTLNRQSDNFLTQQKSTSRAVLKQRKPEIYRCQQFLAHNVWQFWSDQQQTPSRKKLPTTASSYRCVVQWQMPKRSTQYRCFVKLTEAITAPAFVPTSEQQMIIWSHSYRSTGRCICTFFEQLLKTDERKYQIYLHWTAGKVAPRRTSGCPCFLCHKRLVHLEPRCTNRLFLVVFPPAVTCKDKWLFSMKY